MIIDQRRFFTLTATLAASHAACASPPPPVIAVPAEIDPSEAKTARSIEQPKASAITETQTNDPPEDAQIHALGPSEENSAAPLTLRGMSCAPSENLKGSPGVCGTLRPPGPTCESFKDTKAECAQMSRMWKPRIAEKIVGCLQKKSGTQAICKFGVSGECLLDALASSCVDPKTTPACAQVMSRCGTTRWGNITHDACAAAMSAIQDSSRSTFMACVSESCRLEGCEYAFLAPVVESKRPILRR